jgi:hypothetical protein
MQLFEFHLIQYQLTVLQHMIVKTKQCLNHNAKYADGQFVDNISQMLLLCLENMQELRSTRCPSSREENKAYW